MFDEADALPEWVLAELRRPVTASPTRRARIMDRVRTWGPPSPAPLSSAPRPGLRARPWRPRRRRGLASPLLGLALAAGLAGITTTVSLVRPFARGTSDAAAHVTILGDTINATLHDTLRLVQFVLEAPAASHVALVGDFNGWSRVATPLDVKRQHGHWSAVVALRPGRHHYAFVIDDTQWVSGAIEPERHVAPIRSRSAGRIGGDST
jgi:hypothetical protein